MMKKKQTKVKKSKKNSPYKKHKYCINDSIYNENNDIININDIKIEEVIVDIDENISLLRKRI